MKTQFDNAAEQLMQMVTSLPAIKQLVAAEQKQNLETSQQARAKCISRLKALRTNEADMAHKREKAAADLKDAESKLVKFRSALVASDLAAANAARLRQTEEQSLIHEHGEASVSNGLRLLDQLRKEQQRRIDGMQHSRHIDILAGDYVVGRRPNPAFEPAFLARKEELEKIEKAYAEALKLVERDDLAPSQISATMDALLQSAGYRPAVTVLVPA
ncbi:MAG: hypothetical protein KBF98_09950 [Rhodoferax sp.]|nr:hypothetical protein [Rhodoferax sp.]